MAGFRISYFAGRSRLRPGGRTRSTGSTTSPAPAPAPKAAPIDEAWAKVVAAAKTLEQIFGKK